MLWTKSWSNSNMFLDEKKNQRKKITPNLRYEKSPDSKNVYINTYVYLIQEKEWRFEPVIYHM